MTRFRLVHLDLDGTLIDTSQDLVASTNHVRSSFGLEPLEAEAVKRLVGHGARALVERALGSERSELHDEGVRRFLAHYDDHCLDHTRPYPGLEEMLERLRGEGVAFTIVTNKPERLSRKILHGLGLLDGFVAIVGGDTFPERKPDPRGVEHARAVTRAAAADSLMVGDSPVDVATARAAGIACCGVLWGFDPVGLTASGPDVFVTSAAELEAVIRRGP